MLLMHITPPDARLPLVLLGRNNPPLKKAQEARGKRQERLSKLVENFRRAALVAVSSNLSRKSAYRPTAA